MIWLAWVRQVQNKLTSQTDGANIAHWTDSHKSLIDNAVVMDVDCNAYMRCTAIPHLDRALVEAVQSAATNVLQQGW